ncbi:hypothetical protein EDD21DRAFT_391246 [Dissophora ornata]|nr:hypothetical protein EDD21DRAFT_391246 [Dissophora ornata]
MTPSSLVAPPQAPPVPRASIESQSAHIHTNPDCAMTPTPTPSTTPSLPLPSLALPLPLPLPPVTASRAKADTSPASPLCKHSLSLSTPWQQSFENTPAARLFQDKQDDVPDQSIAWSQAALQPCTPPPPLSSSSSPPSPSPSSPSTPFTSAATNISPLLLPWSPISPPCGGGGGGVQLSQISQISTDNRNDKSVDCMAPRICEKVDPVLSTPDRISTLQHLYPLLLKQQEPSQYYPSQQQQPQVVQFRGRGRGIGRGGGHEEPELQLQKELHEEEEHSPKQLRVLLSQPPPLQQSQQQQSQQEQQRPSHSDSIHSNDSNMHCSPQVSRSAAGYLSFLSKKKRASRPYPQPTIVSDSTSSSEATPSVQTTTTSQLALSTSSPSSISGPREGCDETLEPTRLGLVSVVGGSPRQSLSRSHRGSISSPTLSALGLGDSATESQPQPQSATIIATTQQRRDRVITTKKSSAKALLSRAVGFGNQTVSETPRRGAVVADTDTESSEFNHDHKHGDNNNNNNNNNNSVIKKPGIGSYVANEVLSLIFRNLMDRKSILNCSLVSRHWHGPAEAELVRIIQDMPFNGQGLVHAIR